MTDRLSDIRTAIDGFDVERARALLREELRESPSAEAYYLASQVALNDEQRKKFLQEALALDPFHEKAAAALEKSKNGPRPAAPTGPSPYAGTPGYDPVYTPASRIPDFNAPPYGSGAPRMVGASAGVIYADFGSRFLAALVDGIILAVIGFVVGALVGALFGGNLRTPSDLDNFTLLNNLIGAVIGAIYPMYFLVMQNGQTPGKRMMRIRVVRKDGAKLSWFDAFLREVVGKFISAFVLLLGYLWMLWDADKQTWHDKIANTIVIKD